MLACPACDSPNENNAPRCGRCGAVLPRSNGPAATGQAVPENPNPPLAPSALGSTLLLAVPTQKGGFSPIEAAPATLSGPGLRNIFSPGAPGETAPATLQGIADPKARTLMGFGPTATSTAGRLEPEEPVTENVPPLQAAHAPPQGDAADPIPKGRPLDLRGTLMGVSPFFVPQAHPASGETVKNVHFSVAGTEPGSSQQEKVGSVGAGAVRPQSHATILGVAPPTPVVGGSPLAAPPIPAIDERREHAAPNAHAIHKGTLLGVAMPGIAPLRPGDQKHAPVNEHLPAVPHQRRATPHQVGTDYPHSPAAAAALEAAERASHHRSVQRRRLAWILGLASALLVVIVAVATLVWWNSVHLTVAITTDGNGDEQLSFTCGNCPDGTAISLQGMTAEIRAGHTAQLKLPKKLSIGANNLTVSLKRPNRTRSETVKVTVPVEYRVTADLSGLDKDPPRLEVVIEAVPQTLIRLDGKTVAVAQNGTARVPVDVSRELTGASAGIVPLERKLDYVVTQRDGTNIPGSLTARTGIAPLELDAPGLEYYTQNPTFTLSGRTSPKAKLTANGHPIAVQADGTFRQDMALSAPGATRLNVRANEAGMAPRLVSIALERVTDLDRKATELGQGLFTTYDAIVNMLDDKPNSLVALRGEVVAKDFVGPSTRLVVSASCLQAPCLASIRHGAPLAFKRGDRIVAIGRGHLAKRANIAARDLTIEASLVVEDTTRY